MLSRHAALHCSQTVVTQAYSLLCSVHEGVIDEHTPFKSQWWICSQMKTGSIAEAVRATQLSRNGHATCAHLRNDWITNSGNKCRQHNVHNRSESFIYQSFITKLINNRVLTINNYNIVSVQFQVGSLFLMGIKYLWDVDTDVVAAA